MPPPALMSSATALSWLSVLAASNTEAPSSANSRAAAAPIPRPAPEMNATLSANRPVFVVMETSLRRVRNRIQVSPVPGYRRDLTDNGGVDKRELGAFLRSRRERIAPADVGLP